MTGPARSLRPRILSRRPRRDEDPGRGTHRAERPTRRRWGVRVAAGVSLLLLVAAGVGHAVVTGLDTGIDRIDPFEGLSDRPRGSEGLDILVVGTDGRDRVTREERRRYRLGGAPCNCTDTIMLVHLSGDRERASVISLPRDSYAELPAHTDPETGRRHPPGPGKLNSAYARGGPRLTVRTVERMTGVHIDHYIEVDFASFMKTVDAVGGVDVCTPVPLHDDYTGLDLPAGRSTLDGGQALQYVRSRHIDGAADLARMHRQQRFLAALVHRVTDSGVLVNPVRFNRVASALLGSVRADSGFGPGELVALGRAMRGFTPASSEFASVPIEDPGHRVPGLGSTVKWNEKKAARLFRAVRQDRPLASRRPDGPKAAVVDVSPHRVQVQVFNGTHRTGLAARVDRALRATGFDTTGSPGNAVAAPGRTVIAYDPGWNRSARTLAAALPGAELVAVPGQGPRMRVTLGDAKQQVQRVRTADEADANGFAALTGDEVICRTQRAEDGEGRDGRGKREAG